MRAGSTAEVIRLPPNIFRYRRSPWNKYLADGILDHVILTRRETIRLALAFELSEGTPDEQLRVFRRVRDELVERIPSFLNN